MEFRSLLISLLLVFLSQEVQGAYKQINEVCVAGTDTCVHGTLSLACDPVAAVCLIQAGQGCSADGYANLCVSGADCTDNLCTCGAVYAANDGGLCELKDSTALHGGACSDTSDSEKFCAESSNLRCVNEICVCDVDFKLDITTGACKAITVKTFGHSCDSNDTSSCDATTMCAGDAGSEMCVCTAGKTGTPGNVCENVTPTKVGAACTAEGTGGECGAHATCSATNVLCECKANYYGVTGGDCSPALGKLGGACKGTNCDDPHAECSSAAPTPPNTCVCANNYLESAGVCGKFLLYMK
ncbi:hypothetical protein V1264_020457 [Littorina saxatilis]|uniref:Uncharacterized protein n=1 Tax=Littorina saxatilis TaxID=31220 RepID=A0AAN9BBT2_9CAEN